MTTPEDAARAALARARRALNDTLEELHCNDTLFELVQAIREQAGAAAVADLVGLIDQRIAAFDAAE